MPSKFDNTTAERSFIEKCRQKLKAVESVRLEKLAVFKRRKKIAAPVAVIITPILGFIDYWLFLLQRGNEDSAAGITIIALAGLFRWVTKPKREYIKTYKTQLLPEIASLFGNFTYDVKGAINMAAMKPSKIIPSHSYYTSEDHFVGVYQGVGVEFSEIKFIKGSGKHKKIVFNGIAILLSHGTRRFYGHTILTKNQNVVSGWFKKQVTGLKPANMVDLEFENIFDVFTNDQVEARYLIDPVIIENLKTLYKEYDGDKLFTAFYDDHVLILIGSKKNHFEPASIHVPATNEVELMALRQEINQVLSIIDRLALYDPRKKREAVRTS